MFQVSLNSVALPCINPNADPGLSLESPIIANFLRLDSLELGLGLLEDEAPKKPPLKEVTRPLVSPSRLDCRKLANALSAAKEKAHSNLCYRQFDRQKRREVNFINILR